MKYVLMTLIAICLIMPAHARVAVSPAVTASSAARTATTTTTMTNAAIMNMVIVSAAAASVHDYKDENGSYPESTQDLVNGGYIDKTDAADFTIEDGVLVERGLEEVPDKLEEYTTKVDDGTYTAKVPVETAVQLYEANKPEEISGRAFLAIICFFGVLVLLMVLPVMLIR